MFRITLLVMVMLLRIMLLVTVVFRIALMLCSSK